MATMEADAQQRKKRRRRKLLSRAPLALALTAALAIGNELTHLFVSLDASPRQFSFLLRASPLLGGDRSRRLDLGIDGGGEGGCRRSPPGSDSSLGTVLRTVVAAPPSERALFEHMEALTGWPAEDEWDLELAGRASTSRFVMTTRYPHQDGIWGWGDAADRVVLVIPDIRRSMTEYGEILRDTVGYAKIWEDAERDGSDADAASLEDFYAWRDARILEECHRYGWFIDYWMENGLMRDVNTHRVTTPEHWNMLMAPALYSPDELDYDLAVGDRLVTPIRDPHCTSGEVTGGCEPSAVVSAEKLRDHSEGPAEAEAMVNTLFDGAAKYAIARETWDCIFRELNPNNGEGPAEEEGHGEASLVEEEKGRNFSADMLKEMIRELDRLVSKYGGAEWSANVAARRVTTLLVEHRAAIQVESNFVEAGMITLAEEDFLGPKERLRRAGPEKVRQQNDRSFEHFDRVEHLARKQRRKEIRDARRGAMQ